MYDEKKNINNKMDVRTKMRRKQLEIFYKNTKNAMDFFILVKMNKKFLLKFCFSSNLLLIFGSKHNKIVNSKKCTITKGA